MRYVKGFKPSGSMVVAIIALVVASAGTAVAAGLIDGKDLINNSVGSNKVKNQSLKVKDFSSNTKTKLKGDRGPRGAHGAHGAPGPQGPAGPASPATYTNPQWGLIDRNTEGSPVAALRGGPVFGPGAGEQPPLGSGSLGIETADGTEKISFGNQTDFAGDPVSDLDQMGFSYFVTGEDLGRYEGNTPNIQIEIDPSVADKNYTSMVYNPPTPPVAAQQWIADDADANPGGTSGWWFTNGTVAAATGCSQATFCSLGQAQAALDSNNDGGPAASIGSIGIGKGKDYQYQGAADALQVNDTIYDFEPFGVEEVPAP